MEIRNSELSDVNTIFEFYRMATAYMKSQKQVSWPDFPRELIEAEISAKRQWKLIKENQIAGIWATTLEDELIWEKENNDPAVYIHRIATHPDFRGQNLVKHIIDWADKYGVINQLKFIRMDTVGFNEGLIKHYKKMGFDFLGMRKLKNTTGLPDHYNDGEVCFFQRELKAI